MALYRSPLSITLWPLSFLKKYGPMIPPAHKADQTVSFSGYHARLNSTIVPTIMNGFNENMEVSPTRQAQVAACEKLRDTVTGVSALHMSLHDGRSPSPKNSFK
ncbi:hypothetical protein TNCV_2579211 [Trichonephila clavipes]|uniref:Uncharacterized protein n=1 Tax=Trichonephila clavipes TaxID=2585209 RepID=A0A8X6S6T7_TRICX|nr:hypothetical protein TNCV_2579211 [Trichonephila clavipes]